MELKIGNKYKVLKRLGKGAFGDIYAGVNIKTNEEVAIKLVRFLYKSTHLCQNSRSGWTNHNLNCIMKQKFIKFFKEIVSIYHH